MNIRQVKWDAILAKYGQNDMEPLESWETRDVVGSIEALDAELQARAPGDAEEVIGYDALDSYVEYDSLDEDDIGEMLDSLEDLDEEL